MSLLHRNSLWQLSHICYAFASALRFFGRRRRDGHLCGHRSRQGAVFNRERKPQGSSIQGDIVELWQLCSLIYTSPNSILKVAFESHWYIKFRINCAIALIHLISTNRCWTLVVGGLLLWQHMILLWRAHMLLKDNVRKVSIEKGNCTRKRHQRFYFNHELMRESIRYCIAGSKENSKNRKMESPSAAELKWLNTCKTGQ